MLHPVADRTNDHYAKTKSSEVLLVLDSLVCREEDEKPVLGGPAQEFAVLEAAPALLLNGAALAAGEFAR
jgi:hypothetical protein